MTDHDMPQTVRTLLTERLAEMEAHRDRLADYLDQAEGEVAKHQRGIAETQAMIADIKAMLG